jgi:KDO2-lipid IV(A) lauroyltransferase
MFLIKWVSLLPFWFWYGVSDIMFVLVYYVFGYRKDVVRSNIELAFPDKSPKEVKTIMRQFYCNLMDVMVETIKGITVSEANLRKRITVQGGQDLYKYVEQYPGVVCMGSHHTNWEYMQLRFSATYKFPLLGVYKKLSNQSVEKLMVDMRSKFGSIPVEIQDALSVVRAQKNFFAIGLISDQSPQVRKKTLWMEFFGKSVPVYQGPMVLARLFKLPVVFIHMRRIKRGHYQMYLEPIAQPPYTNVEEQIMAKYINILETEIREDPAGYLWSHKRWKHALPEVDKADGSD